MNGFSEEAERIKTLEAALKAIIRHQELVGGGIAEYSTTKLIAERCVVTTTITNRRM